jgi:hypothetical protein
MRSMIRRNRWLSIGVVFVLATLLLAAGVVLAQGPGNTQVRPAGGSPTETFSYQAQLTDAGAPANGNYDFIIDIYDGVSPSANHVASCPGYTNIPVQDGLLNLNLVCGGSNSTVFDGGPRWIELQVAHAGMGDYVGLDRQAIAPVPYAWSLHPGAVLSETAVIHSVAETQLAINPFEIEATSELANNLTLSFLHHWSGYTEIENTTNIGSSTIYVPVHNLTQLFGSSLKLKSLEVCYKIDTASSYIDQTRVYYANAAGGRTEIMTDYTNRTSTGWGCYTINNMTPAAIEGPLLVYFNLYFAGTGGLHTITIGQITATLVE